MKKIIALALTLVMVVSAFCMSVNAAPIVGSHGEKGTIEDGIAEATFTSSSLFESVILNLGGTHSRYAVDVTFPTTLTFSSSAFIWNVNTLQYDQPADFSLANTTFSFGITNYSDVPVDVAFNIQEITQLESFGGQMNFDKITNISDTWGADADFTIGTSGDYSFNGQLKGVYAVNENKGNRSATSIEFNALMSAQDNTNWKDIIGKYMLDSKESGTTTYTLARFTVTVSKLGVLVNP